MIIDKNPFTKLERKELRRLAGLAYERELAKALGSLEESFRQWKKNKITAFELSDLIRRNSPWSCHGVTTQVPSPPSGGRGLG